MQISETKKLISQAKASELHILEETLKLHRITYEDLKSNKPASKNKIMLLLRQIVVQHLTGGEGTVAQGFRQNYKIIMNEMKESLSKIYDANDQKFFEEMNDFLTELNKDRTWITDIVIKALAEIFDLNIMMQEFKHGITEPLYQLHQATNDNRPKIVIANIDNVHFKFDDKTIDNGNCGLDAIREALKVLLSTIHSDKPSQSIFSSSNIFNSEDSSETKKIKAIRRQQDRLDEFEQQMRSKNDVLTPVQIKHLQEQEDRNLAIKIDQEMNSPLTAVEHAQKEKIKRQITKDYEYALRLEIKFAKEDAKSNSMRRGA